MEKTITCFIPFTDNEALSLTIKSLKGSGVVSTIFTVIPVDHSGITSDAGTGIIRANGFSSTDAIIKMGAKADTEYVLVYGKTFPLDLGRHTLNRMMQVCDDTAAGFVYSDYYENKEGSLSPHPVTDYQEGSLRDDFNFGSVILYRGSVFRDACKTMTGSYLFAGFYDLRLNISRTHRLFHIQEMLYSEVEKDTRKSGEKQFDYVDPRNRVVQEEMEKVCTNHLKAIEAWLKPLFEEINFETSEFDNEVSVIIPVKNRARTVGDAINSVLSQKSRFSFNLIIVDNYSDDGTTEIIRSFAKDDNRVVHIIPERKDLGIGGCWNEAVFSESCGRFAVQLDSDDLYIDETVITRVVEAFHEQKCAMVVGSYRMVNFDLQDIPPGLIDHREWTPDNGRNNALRINGLGAPRAFYTPVLRSIRVPNVSYGEDYAVGLAISRHYRIGRIYEPLYLCRRWDENSDAALDVAKMNTHNFYKDKVRTIELLARQKMLSETVK
ncbi:MAG: glycosyltransferase family 2 protein [Bacteroidales bacterium]|nr:glycosyltransferase family 2 protein [Bacteroidales bacterium]